MSRRKRHSTRPQLASQIEWFKDRTGYPTSEEREQIIQIRKTISEQVMLLRLDRVSINDRRYRALVDKYGNEEIQRVERKFRESADTASRVADDAKSYREYRLRYSKFGSGLKFYSAKEMNALYDSYFEQVKSAMDNRSKSLTDVQNELEESLLMGWRDWDDITPHAIPSCPSDYNITQPVSYSAPVNELLEWGDDLHRTLQFANEVELLKWKSLVPVLTRMALDPGLLEGWPTEKASWAPWHAMHALGIVQAWESAPALAELANIENDWLSDHLPHVWADMGRQAEPSLWMILESSTFSSKQRSLAAEALFMMTEQSKAIYEKVIRGYEKILQNTKNVDVTLNGYLVMFLKDMNVSANTLETMNAAFESSRVNGDIIRPNELEENK